MAVGDPADGGFRPLRGKDVDTYLERQRQQQEPNFLSNLAPAGRAITKADPGARFMCIRVGCTRRGLQRYFCSKAKADAHEGIPGHEVVAIPRGPSP